MVESSAVMRYSRRTPVPEVSVIMPTFDQEAYLPAAVDSLLRQSLSTWELIVVDDGSPGNVQGALGPALWDPRVQLRRHSGNRGLGAALNTGLGLATGPFVAYLPSDDAWHVDHLASLVDALKASPPAALAVAGIQQGQYAGVQQGRYEVSMARLPGEPLHLVQVMHRRTPHRWLERAQLTTDDLGRMLWSRVLDGSQPVLTNQVTCTRRRHPWQRSVFIREPRGGLNAYRARYQVKEPLRFQSTVGSLHDETAQYGALRARSLPPRTSNGLKILLVGELAHNPERVLALVERGHELYGLWTPDPLWFNTVGPLPFGHVTDLPRNGWQEAVRSVNPDVIYALLNWQAVPFAHRVLNENLGIPFVWHFKEGPFSAQAEGYWDWLVELHLRSNAQIYSSPELRDWFFMNVPGSRHNLAYVLDGDLPKRDLLVGERSALLSETDGDVHTVIAGRPIGPAPEVIKTLADRAVHVHLYGEKVAAQSRDWVAAVQRVAPRHLHLHPQVDHPGWVREFSRYDAGWLHDFVSHNRGDLHAAVWDDLNIPARVATLVAAGVPLIQRDNSGHLVATQTLARERDIGVFWDTPEDLASQLHDRRSLHRLRENAWRQRAEFTFDDHVDGLVDCFRTVTGRQP